MSYTWGEVKDAVSERLEFNRMSVNSLDTTHNSAFSNLCLLCLQDFFRRSKYIAVDRQAIDVADTTEILDLADATVIGSTGLKIFEISKLWINEKPVLYKSVVEIEPDGSIQDEPARGDQITYYQHGPYTYKLSHPVDDDYEGKVSGYGTIQAPASNSAVIPIADYDLHAISKCIAVTIAEDVTGNEGVAIALKIARKWCEEYVEKVRATRASGRNLVIRRGP